MRKKTIFYPVLILLLGSGYLYYRYIGAGITLEDFQPFSNYKSGEITVDLSDAVYRGIEIPTVQQLPGGKFTFTFKVKNRGFNSKKFYYKIYYQDESYKFPEYTQVGKFKYENPLATRNFYGSWGGDDSGFKSTKELGWGDEIYVTDS